MQNPRVIQGIKTVDIIIFTSSRHGDGIMQLVRITSTTITSITCCQACELWTFHFLIFKTTPAVETQQVNTCSNSEMEAMWWVNVVNKDILILVMLFRCLSC